MYSLATISFGWVTVEFDMVIYLPYTSLTMLLPSILRTSEVELVVLSGQ